MISLLKSSGVVAAVCVALSCGPEARADTVERRDGSRVDGTVASVDDTSVMVRTSSGTMRIPRADVATIAFDSVKPIKVEIRNVKSDDAVDALVNGDEVIRDARDGGEWTDITARLKDGNNAVRLRIHNDRGDWAYHLNLRLNGQVVPLACGTPQSKGRGCKEGGRTGHEIGVIEDLPVVWIHVDRALGRVEILP